MQRPTEPNVGLTGQGSTSTPSRLRAFVPPCLRASPPPLRAFVPSCLLPFLLSPFLTGCGHDGTLLIQSEGDGGAGLHGEFASGVYRLEDSGQFTALLTTGPPDNPGRALAIRLLWAPKSAKTPLDPDATNASMRYVVFRDDQVAIYHGGGFVRPHHPPGDPMLSARVEQANLYFLDATPGFEDPNDSAQVEGTITLRRDKDALQQALRRLSLQVTSRLGHPRFVRADRGGLKPANFWTSAVVHDD